ncbi:MAG TPA: hypothetical protein VF691_12880, partial [Cytophagaceae bacterium]
VTVDTIFLRLRFPILKAFYIIYRTSSASDTSFSNPVLAQEINIRVATLWSFKKKVLDLIEETKTKKKHKDGWTHLIEYSIKASR